MIKITNITPEEATKLLLANRGVVTGLEFSNNEVGWHRHHPSLPTKDLWLDRMTVSAGVLYYTDGLAWSYCRRVWDPPLTEEEKAALKLVYPKTNYAAWDQNGKCYVYDTAPVPRPVEFANNAYMQRVEAFDNRWKGDWRDSVTML